MLNLIWVGLLFCFNGCGGGDEPSVTTETSLSVTVKGTGGNIAPNTKVYIFDQSADNAGGKDPAGALQSAMTDNTGKVLLDVKSLATGTYYITVLEEVFASNLSVEHVVLGTKELALEKGQTLNAELTLTADKSLKYSSGFIPTTITSKLAMDEYKRWRAEEVVSCSGGLRVIAEATSETKVEAMGFGMLLAAYAKDKETFDGLFTFYKSKRTTEAMNMMAWAVTCDGFTDKGSATDGDIDVAFALIVASKQWSGGTYLDDAKAILTLIRDNLFKSCTVGGQSIYIVGPGYNTIAWGGCDEMDLMYHTPAFFRVFASVTGDAAWEKLANDTYVTLNTGAHPTTGLVPDWQKATGGASTNTSRVHYFGYDACRAPWRLTLDYLWNGNTQSQQWASKVSTWANGVGAPNIVDGYELNGTKRGTNKNSSFLGGFAVASMARDQATVDAFSTELSKLNDTYWFNINTRVLYLFTLTGNFWNPLEK
jgi:endoglucanase